MEPSAAQQLREFHWASITTGLRNLAASWTRLRVEHLPLKDQSLESLQSEYQDLLEAMPVSAATEIETALRQFTRGLRLKGDRVTATQQQYLRDYSAPRRLSPVAGYSLPAGSYDGSYAYLEPLLDRPETPAKAISMGALLYVGAHRSLGVRFPTFTDAFRDRLLEPQATQTLLDSRGTIMLDRVLQVHSRWIAEQVAQSKAEPIVLAKADRPDYGDGGEEQAAGSWLDEFLEEEVEEDESGWPTVPVPDRHYK